MSCDLPLSTYFVVILNLRTRSYNEPSSSKQKEFIAPKMSQIPPFLRILVPADLTHCSQNLLLMYMSPLEANKHLLIIKRAINEKHDWQTCNFPLENSRGQQTNKVR
uniref:Uncharacterized protein n=1 Tax=Photinus pyralis TaxID=7054 RepID=A0A1Y1K2Y2_PHOPY